MDSKPRPTIGLFTGTEGHLSIAEAIKETLDPEYQVELFLDRDFLMNLYLPIYQLFPAAFSVPFRLAQNGQMMGFFKDLFLSRYGRKITTFLKKYRPAVTISTYFMYSPNLASFKERHHIPFINIATDPRSIHPLIVAPEASTNFVFDQHAASVVASFAPDAPTEESGWFVRERFERTYDQQHVRKKLGLDPATTTFLVASGSEGTGMIAKLIPLLLTTTHPLQVIVACGSNKTLYKSTRALQKMLAKTRPNITIIALPFTSDIHEYMQAADLIIGKAGPNTIFEAAATLTPFFAITHISGQEDGNLDIILEYNLGYVEENPLKAQKLLETILAQPKKLHQFKPHLQKMAERNKKAKEHLKKRVAKLLTSPKK